MLYVEHDARVIIEMRLVEQFRGEFTAVAKPGAGAIAQACKTDPDAQSVGIAFREQPRHCESRSKVLRDRADVGIRVTVLSEHAKPLRARWVAILTHQELIEDGINTTGSALCPTVEPFKRSVVKPASDPKSSGKSGFVVDVRSAEIPLQPGLADQKEVRTIE